MKKKLSALIVSFALIAVCVSIIAGATFALFTSEDGVNIAVSSAKVNVSATIEDVQTKALNTEYAAGTNNAFGTIAIQEASQTSQFPSITLDKIVPGDSIKFNIVVKNNSNIEVLFRSFVNVTGDITSALEISIGSRTSATTGLVSYDSGYARLAVGSADVVLPVEISLPEEVGNSYQNKSGSISLRVEAIQGNAGEVGSEKYVTATAATANELTTALASLGSGDTVLLTDDLTVDSSLSVAKGTNIDLGGHTITTSNPMTAAAAAPVAKSRRAQGAGSLATTISNGIIINNGTGNNFALRASADLVLDGVRLETTYTFGVYCMANGLNVTINNSYIQAAAFGIQIAGSTLTATDSEFVSTATNTAYACVKAGGKVNGVYTGGTVILTNCKISGEICNGVSLERGSHGTITGCTVNAGSCGIGLFDIGTTLAVADTKVNSKSWALSTNASDNPSEIAITATNCELISESSAVMFNVNTTFIMDNCIVKAEKRALFLRAGNIIAKNCTIESKAPVDANGETWVENGANESVPCAAIVIGTDPANKNYPYTANVTIVNCTVSYTDSDSTLYVFVMSPTGDNSYVAGRTTIVTTDLDEAFFQIVGDTKIQKYVAE